MQKEIIGSIIVSLIVLLAIGLQYDDALNPEVSILLEKFHAKETSQAYFYLLGFTVSEQDEPISVGQTIFKSMQQGEKNTVQYGVPFTYDDYPDKLKIDLPEGDFFCHLPNMSCAGFLFKETSLLEEALAKNTLILKRYLEFIQYDDYSTLMNPSLFEPMPDYYPIIKANRLLLISSIVQARYDAPEQAMIILNNNRTNLRQQLRMQDTLIGKMVFVRLIANNLDVSFLLSREYEAISFQTISLLSIQEKDLEMVMARELRMGYDLYQSLAGHPEIFEQGGNAPEWYVNMLYKPNMTINAVYPFYREVIDASRLSPVEFVQYVSGSYTKPGMKISQVRNIVGTILNQIERPDYNNYIAWFFDLDSKILLFNSLINQPDIESRSITIPNPYYPAGTQVAAISKDGHAICFNEGPLANEEKRRCLQFKY